MTDQPILHEIIQGENAWHEFRLEHFGASEAAAMLGISRKVTRTELLHAKATGIAREFSDWVQTNILDRGHEVEALARPIVEDMIGTELFPVTCSKGKLSASCDGLSMDETIAWENKQRNAEYFDMVSRGELPEEHWPQCQQILYVTGAEKLFFTISDGTIEGTVGVWVYPDAEKQKQIIGGWQQFERDLEGYAPRVITEKPVVADIENLPAIAVQIRGEVVTSNLPVFKASAQSFLAQINTDLQTDEDFAIAEKVVKHCEKVEKELDLTKRAAIAQTASIDELMRTIDAIQGEFRAKRLQLDKLVKTQKDVIKSEIILKAQAEYKVHVDALEETITPIRLTIGKPDFAGAAKNKRTLATLHDAVDTALANAKIDATNIAEAIQKKLYWYLDEGKDYAFLFHDLQALIYKEPEDFMLQVMSRIGMHKAAEERRIEAERQRIQAEAEQKAQREIEEKMRAEQEVEAKRLREQVIEPALAAAEKIDKPVSENQEVFAPNEQSSGTPEKIPADPSGFDVVELVARHWSMNLQHALLVVASVDYEECQRMIVNRTKAEALRKSARFIRESAQRAERTADVRREIEEAEKLERKAAELEKAASTTPA